MKRTLLFDYLTVMYDCILFEFSNTYIFRLYAIIMCMQVESLAGGIDFSIPFSRARFEEINLDLFKKTITPVTQVLKDAGIDKKDISQIVLVGGSTRIPKVVACVIFITSLLELILTILCFYRCKKCCLPILMDGS